MSTFKRLFLGLLVGVRRTQGIFITQENPKDSKNEELYMYNNDQIFHEVKKNRIISMFYYIKPFGKGTMEFWETIESR